MAYDRAINTGSLWKNDKKVSDKHPSARGEMLLACPHCSATNEFFLSAWTNTTQKGDKYQSIKIDPKPDATESQSPKSVELDDEIPF